MLCGTAPFLDEGIKWPQAERKVWFYFSAYEEVGHGTAWIPADTKDVIAVDIAPTGPQQTTTEHKVTLIAKDKNFPYHRELTNELCKVAEAAGVDYVVDVFNPNTCGCVISDDTAAFVILIQRMT